MSPKKKKKTYFKFVSLAENHAKCIFMLVQITHALEDYRKDQPMTMSIRSMALLIERWIFFFSTAAFQLKESIALLGLRLSDFSCGLSPYFTSGLAMVNTLLVKWGKKGCAKACCKIQIHLCV